MHLKANGLGKIWKNYLRKNLKNTDEGVNYSDTNPLCLF